MRKSIDLVLLLFLTMTVYCQTKNETNEFNFGFEKITSKQKLPDNYTQKGKGYDVSIDSITKHSGNYSVLIQSSDTASLRSFGCVSYNIPAVYEGKEIELRSFMKLKDVKEKPIDLMLRIDGSSGMLAYANMYQKDIQGTSGWTMYSVKLALPEDARTIFIFAMLIGTGQVWVDDFELLIDGKDISQAKHREINKAEKDNEFDKGSAIEAFNLSEEKVNNLKTLGLVWGFLKYYHPNIAAGDYNWDYELFRVLPKIIQSGSPQNRDSVLTEWIKSLGTFEVVSEATKSKEEIKIRPDLGWITDSNFSSDLTSQLVQIKNAKREKKNYYLDFVEDNGNPIFKNEKVYAEMTYPDLGFRLLSLYRYWNTIQYFFPYKNLIEEDWKDVLKEFIPKYINAPNDVGYKLAVMELIARIHDTHATIRVTDQSLNTYWGQNYAPVKIKFIEIKAVVIGFNESEPGMKSGLLVGDVITKVNQKSVEEIVTERLKYASASNYPAQLRTIAMDLLRTNDTTITIEFIRNKKPLVTEIKTYSSAKINIYADPQSEDTCFKFITPDIGYLYLGSIKNEYLPNIMSAVKNTKGLIIDLRCYPSDGLIFSMGEYLMPDSTNVVKWSTGSIINPGLFTITDGSKVGKKNSDFYKGKVIILVNEITQSSAEYHAMAFRAAPKAKVIGSTTAGADGNVSPISLPGGIGSAISGIGVYYPDGRETQRLGIVPDIEIKPTLKGIIEGRDEILYKAIGIINNQ